MIRNIVMIDEERCNGCGLCINGCAEGALKLVNGKAKLLSDAYCDGLGACLPVCPVDAIKLIEREAEEFDEVLVHARMQEFSEVTPVPAPPSSFVCPGSAMRVHSQKPAATITKTVAIESVSQLNQWPVQIKLISPHAPFFDNANLLIAADCSAYAYADFHQKFIKNRVTLIGCPKLDDVDYADKLSLIIRNNSIKSVTVVRMEVPCCGGIEHAVKNALLASGKMIPWQVVVITTDGEILEN